MRHLALLPFALTIVGAAKEAQAPCPSGGADCLRGIALGPSLAELSALGSALGCAGLHDSAGYADALGAAFKASDANGDGRLNVDEAEQYVSGLPTTNRARLQACIDQTPKFAPVSALLKRNSCGLCYAFVDAGEHLWPLRVFKSSGLCATSRHCELGFLLTTTS